VIFNLHGRKFAPVENSEHGHVNSRTIFRFQQQGHLIVADYSGGGIRAGHIIGHFKAEDRAELRYHCVLDTNALKAGKAIATFSHMENGRMAIDMNWQWLEDLGEAGRSRYEEVL